jgi:quercetin dioxygenase-like cupin family protein
MWPDAGSQGFATLRQGCGISFLFLILGRLLSRFELKEFPDHTAVEVELFEESLTVDLKVGFMFVESHNSNFEQVEIGVSRQLLGHDAQLMMVTVRFEKGAVGPLHSHPHRQVSYIVSGKFEVQIREIKKILSSGDSYFVEPDAIHGVLALEAGTIVDAFAPCRKDFLKP